MVPREVVLAWAEGKLQRKALTIRDARTVEVAHKRPLGARGEYAKIVIHAAPADRFAFTSIATWPTGEDYFEYVKEGLLDEILAGDLGSSISRITFRLESVGWHDIDSCPRAFYAAARTAFREVIGPGFENVDFDVG